MSEALSSPGKSIPWFQIFKYTVYSLLCINTVFFFQEEYAASAFMFSNGINFSQMIEAYSATIDTASWVVLLLVFEMETHVISDEKLHGLLKAGLNGLKGLCYVFILYALYGYISTYTSLLNFESSAVTELCSMAGQSFSFMTTLDEFVPIASEGCLGLSNSTQFFELPGTTILADAETLKLAQNLAMIDVINATTWVCLVFILTIDIWLQMKEELTDKMMKVSTYIKAVIYLILIACAVFWGIDGKFIDFWDAFLWIVAFFFIEMNLFEWHAEVEERVGHHDVA
ncbi:hypothetical protein [Maricurvus nonylphenolicus]|uniref:hypothetical protein n=1 Tax=Maricurvus nonylphenolicus TaxID=1008307 RepID=UPI0036F3919A